VSDIITVDELAEYMKVNRKTIYNMVKEGELPGARRFRDTIRIHKPTVLAWIAAGESTPVQRKRRR
jgi:excisionase family DNA binding protein